MRSEAAQKQMAQARWIERRYQALIENSSDIVSLLDAQGNILYKSPSIERVLGYGPDDLIGTTAFGVAHPDDRPHLTRLFVYLLEHPGERLIGEFRHLHKDGSYRWVEGAAVNLLGDPAIQAIVFNYRDVTERKQAETALEEARTGLKRYAEELEERVAQRTARLEESLRSLRGVLYHVAHDLRAPLRAVSGFTTLLLERIGPNNDPTTLEYGATVSHAAGRMDDHIHALLEYGKLGHMDLPARTVQLDAEVARVVRHLEKFIQEKHAEVIVSEPLPAVWAHARTVQKIILSLLDNALKFVDPDVPPLVRIWADEKNGKVNLYVADNGIGIPREFQDKIFHVFERLDVQMMHPGTGIGLAIAREAAERMGGTVGVESQPGAGSTFWITLPAAKTEA